MLLSNVVCPAGGHMIHNNYTQALGPLGLLLLEHKVLAWLGAEAMVSFDLHENDDPH